ncbi:putative glucose dehydrogenase [Ophiocordyceps camponoti-floridani]|uniref:Putative glucose dehydrogenase n=1 Tax=Ophiocordyceps camponoti-floridani TaxID=2030778 RepID=A0A8H4Q0H6_9HYPO|nr:putative glucose dehydrogenase [Ophiocordyceps camponoti-floridani]
MFSRCKNPVYHPRQYAAEVPPGAPCPTPGATPQYDYIVVGAGAAGSVLASRLSEDSSVSVLVLEAGGDNNVLDSRIPSRYTMLWRGKHDWGYSTIDQPGLDGKQLPWPRGKMIGDLDEWASVYGCKGWSYKDVAPYFRRMEGFTPNSAHPVDLDNRGIDGRWKTGFGKLTPLVEHAFIAGCQEAGIPATPDFNTPAGTLGVSQVPAFIDSRGVRSSLATSFLAPDVMKRSNLTVAVYSHVSKVLFNEEKPPTAIGVEIRVGSQYFHVTAGKEVILCGGSVNTPQLLMLSGIGPEDQLKKHGIPIIKRNEAVGRNLKDHLVSLMYCRSSSHLPMNSIENPIWGLSRLLRWFLTGRGEAASNVVEAAAFIRTSEFQSKGKSSLVDHGSCNVGPDVELLCLPFGIDVSEAKPIIADKESFVVTAVGLRPQSTGTITLQSADCFASPIIDPNYLSDEGGNDLKVMVAAIRVCVDIIRTPSFSAHLRAVPPNDDPMSLWWPSSSSKEPEDIPDEDLIRFIRRKPFTLYHPVGTARMGPSPEDSVVDLECRVRGVKGLRVIDASVFPEQISGHPTALIGAMAYKLADTMKRG